MSAVVESRGPKTVSEYLRANRAAVAALSQSVHDELHATLNRTRAAFWLLESLKVGELSGLGRPGRVPPCWLSEEAVPGMKMTDLEDCLEHLAREGLSRALGELVGLLAREGDLDEEPTGEAAADDA